MTIVRYTLDTVPEVSEEQMAKIRAMRDEDIDYSDIPPLTDEFWENAKKFDELYRPQKQQITVRVDADILAWLKSGGKKGYQTRLNNALRYVMQHQIKI